MMQVIIRIPDMQSAHCQARVRNAVNTIEGVQVDNTEAGKITLSLGDDRIKDEAISAIEKAGYTVSSEEGNNSLL